MKARTTLLMVIMTVMLIGMTVVNVSAHCEIPCGIYHDDLRIKLIKEHATTIEKSITQIEKLSAESPVNYNQLVRWITNKEDHANKIQDIVSQYFLTQRIKPTQEMYSEKVQVLHQMLVAAMKCKQSTKMENVEKVRELTDEFVKLYFDDAAKEHLLEHEH